MHAKGPLDAPVTPRNIVGGATWGLRNGFDVAPRGARAPHARPRARPFPVTARFGHPLLENRFPRHLFGMLSLGGVRAPAPTQTSGVTSRKGAFFGQVKNLARATIPLHPGGSGAPQRLTTELWALAAQAHNSGDGTASRKWPPRTQNQAHKPQPCINPVAGETHAPATPSHDPVVGWRRMEYYTVFSGAKVEYN